MSLELLALGAASFVAVGLKGFQQKNVVGNHYVLIMITSYLMAAGDVVLLLGTYKFGWSAVPYLGTGSSLGMLTAVFLHNKWVSK